MGRPRPAAADDSVVEYSSDEMQSNASPVVRMPASSPPSDPNAPHAPAAAPHHPPPDSDKPNTLPVVVADNPVPIPPPAAPPTHDDALNHHDHQKIGRPWTTGLFDCGDNQTNAMMTSYCPCVTFGQIAEILDEGETSCTIGSFLYILMAPALCTCWILGANYRLQLRHKYNLVQAPAEDFIVHLFCPFCALCQEFRELHNRGIDPSLGWMGYLAQQQETRTIPPNGQFMNK